MVRVGMFQVPPASNNVNPQTTMQSRKLKNAARLGLLGGAILCPISAYALSDSALSAAISPPRQGISASPVMALTGEAPSESSSMVVSSAPDSGSVTSGTPADSGSAPAGGGSTKTGSSGGGASGKGMIDKNPVVTPASPKPEFTISAGWDSKYMFKGFDNIAGSSVERPDDVGIWYTKATMTYQGFGFLLGYLQADSKTTPKYNPDGGSDYYSEVIMGVNYTAAIVGGVLDGTVGYNMYYLPNGDYWNNDYQGEVWARLAYVQFPWLTPSVTYSYFHADNDILTGHAVEFRLDSKFSIYDGTSFGVGLNPYVSANLDSDFNTSGTNWGGVEVGLSVPITIGNNLILALSGSYGWDAGDDVNYYGGRPPEREGLWGGASLTYRF